MNRNIALSYWLVMSRSSWFWLGIWLLYYLRFTSYVGVGILEWIMIVASTLFELPTGGLADVIGKRQTLILAFSFMALGNLILAIAPNIFLLGVGIVVTVLGGASYSGTLEALVYDSLLLTGQEKNYERVLSRQKAMISAWLILATLIGGWAYTWWPGLPFALNGVFAGAGAILSFFIIEPAVATQPSFSWQKYQHTLVSGWRSLWKNAKISYLSLTILVMGGVMMILFEGLDEMLLVQYGHNSTSLSLLMAIVNGAIVVSITALTPLLHRWFNPIVSYLLLTGSYVLTLLLVPVATLIMGSILFTIRIMIMSQTEIIESDLINQQVASSHRASSLSTLAMLKKIPYVLAVIPIGLAADQWSPRSVVVSIGLLMLVGWIWFTLRYRELSNQLT